MNGPLARLPRRHQAHPLGGPEIAPGTTRALPTDVQRALPLGVQRNTGKAFHGTVTICNRGDSRSSDLHELYCYEAAAGEPVACCSGAPMFIGREIVGIVRAIKQDGDLQALLAANMRMNPADVAARAVGGTVYSTPIGQALEWITTPHPGYTPPAALTRALRCGSGSSTRRALDDALEPQALTQGADSAHERQDREHGAREPHGRAVEVAATANRDG